MVANYFNTSLNGNVTYRYFDDTYRAFVTLFDLFTEKNWEVAVAFEALKDSYWTRVYFLVYRSFSIIMFAYITALILHTFLLKTRYKEKTDKEEGEVLVETTRIVLNRDEVKFLNSINETQGLVPDSTLIMANCDHLEFEGINFIVADELHQALNEENIREWIEQENFFSNINEKSGVVDRLKKSMKIGIKRKSKSNSSQISRIENERKAEVPDPEIKVETPPDD